MADLKHYSGTELFFNNRRARAVLAFFFPDIPAIDYINLTEKDRSFAQAIMIKAMDASKKIGRIQKLWETTAKPNAAVTDIAKELFLQAGKDWFNGVNTDDMDNPVLYEMVVKEIRRQTRSMFKFRIENGEFLGGY